MAKGQASLELFFTISLFVLVLFWLNNFLDTASAHSQDFLLKQRESIASDIARLANTACILEEEITAKAPCLLDGGKHKPYALILEAQKIKVDNVTREAVCDLVATQLVAESCDAPLCFKNVENKVSVVEGICV